MSSQKDETITIPVHRVSTITSSSMEDFRIKNNYGREGTLTTDLLANRLSDLYKSDGCVLEDWHCNKCPKCNNHRKMKIYDEQGRPL